MSLEKMDERTVKYCQALREIRHQDMYGGFLTVSEDELTQAIKQAEMIFEKTKELLSIEFPKK